MSFKLLAFVFKIGSILASTPDSIEIKKATVGQKSYILLILVSVTVAYVFKFIRRNFFLQYIHLKIVLCFLDEFSLYALTFYYTIIICIFKRLSWKDLIENLESTSYLVHVKKGSFKRPYYFEFVVTSLLHFASSAYVVYVGWKTQGLSSYLGEEGIDHFLIYLDFFNKFVLCVILKMLLARYQGLRHILESSLKRQQPQLPSVLMKDIGYAMCYLNRTVDIYNDLFAWPTFLMISSTALEILNVLDSAMFHYKDLQLLDNIVINATLLLWIFVTTCVMVLMCDYVVQEAEKIVSLSHDLRWSFRKSGILDDLKFEEFTSLLARNVPTFTAASFFDVGRWTILDLLGTVVTFLIVMIQFGNT